MGLLAYNHLLPKSKKEVVVDENKETLKADMARSLLAGKSLIEEEDDVFEGLSPKEIEKYVASVTNHASIDDPYEGLSPEEIDEYIRTHGDQQAKYAMR
ncbi:hypothetical protein H632_c572p0 [Helicosporidium sp. ATCC 50920]|nr:hypothetical protein H632_c572p0 [Helicosporidium sp. ATCC 50920]|eukprot:KDD75647.1 hypothetical protein H632_c572p0 [Helicosporidium sp. ATCC 50920]